jgi:cytoskeletal protein CcmA (bactofilin family)
MAEKAPAHGDVTLIGSGSVVEGTIRTEGGIRVDGRVVGEIAAKSSAAVGPTGILEGSLSARNISIGGKVQGNLSAMEKLTLEAKSIVAGDIRAARLVVDEGAMFDGRCSMSSAAQVPSSKS